MSQPVPSPTDDAMRDRILDAADACIARYGVQKTTIDDVIKKAGVARATLYKHVPGGREELVLAVIVREAERNVDTVIAAMSGGRTLEDSLTAGLLASIERIRADDHLAYLMSPDVVGVASRFDRAGEVLVDATARLLRPYLAAGREQDAIAPGLTDRDIADWMIRITASILWFDGIPRDAEELTSFVRTFVVRPLLATPEAVVALR